VDAKRNTFGREYYLKEIYKNCIEYSEALENNKAIKPEYK